MKLPAQKPTAEPGFTLIEALMCIMIFSVILLGAYGVLATGNTVRTNDNALVEVQQQARNAMGRIVREVRQSSTHSIVALGANNYKITFTTPAAAGIMYYLSGTNLVREYPVNTKTNIASNIALLKFTLSSTLLQIDIRSEKSLFNKIISFPLTEKVRLRNE